MVDGPAPVTPQIPPAATEAPQEAGLQPKAGAVKGADAAQEAKVTTEAQAPQSADQPKDSFGKEQKTQNRGEAGERLLQKDPTVLQAREKLAGVIAKMGPALAEAGVDLKALPAQLEGLVMAEAADLEITIPSLEEIHAETGGEGLKPAGGKAGGEAVKGGSEGGIKAKSGAAGGEGIKAKSGKASGEGISAKSGKAGGGLQPTSGAAGGSPSGGTKTVHADSSLASIFTAAGLANMDVSEAAFLVLQMATKDMDEDIKVIMAEIKAMTAAKAKLRTLINDLNKWISHEMPGMDKDDDINKKAVGQHPDGSDSSIKKSNGNIKYDEPFPDINQPDLVGETQVTYDIEGTVTVQALKDVLDQLKGKLDGMNEMSEMTSLRLQMTMDRRSKFISTLSNIMKKISTTQDTLTQNVK